MLTLARLSVIALFATACASSTTATTQEGRASINGKATFSNDAVATGIVVRLSGPTSAVTQAGPDGAYSFARLLAGSYLIEVSSPDAVESAKVTTLTLKETDVATATDLVLTGTGGLTGKVFTAAGTPAEGASVLVPGTTAVGAATASGTFSLARIPAGTVDLLVTLPGKGQVRASGVVIQRGKTTQVPDLTLAAAPTGFNAIKGAVVIAGVTALGGYGVSLQGPTSAGVVTAADGSYSFEGLADGKYVITAVVRSTLQVAVTLTVQVLGGQTKTGQDLSFSPTGTVKGKAIFDPATATGNAGIAVTTLGTLSVTFTDEEGRYTLYGVPSFNQNLVASYPGYTQDTAPVIVPFDATLTIPDDQPLVLGAPAGPVGRISGTASFSPKISGGNAGIEVLLVGPQGGKQVTSATGAYSFTGLSDGTYFVQANGPSTREGLLHRTVTIANGAPQPNNDFAFTPVGSIQGYALVGNVGAGSVLVYAIGTDRSTLTDDLGHWVLTGLVASTVAQVQGTMVGALSQIETEPAVQYNATVQSDDLILQPRSTTDLLASSIAFVDPSVDGQVVVRASQGVGGAEVSSTFNAPGDYSLSVPDGFWALSFATPDNEWHDTIPAVAAFPGGKGFVWDREIFPLAPFTMQYGARAVSTPKIGGFAVLCPVAAKAVPAPKGVRAVLGAQAPAIGIGADGEVFASRAEGRMGFAGRDGNLLYLADYECTTPSELPYCKGKLHFASQGKDVLLSEGPIFEGTYWIGPDNSAFFAYGPNLAQMQLYVAKLKMSPTVHADLRLLSENFRFVKTFGFSCGLDSAQGGTTASFYSDLASTVNGGMNGQLHTVDVNDSTKDVLIANDTNTAVQPVVTADGQNIWYQLEFAVVQATSIAACRASPTGKCGVTIPNLSLGDVTFSSDGKAVIYRDPNSKLAEPLLGSSDGTGAKLLAGVANWAVERVVGGDLLVTYTSSVSGKQTASLQAFMADSTARLLGSAGSVVVSLTPDTKNLLVQTDNGSGFFRLFVTPAAALGADPQWLVDLASVWAVQGGHAAIIVNESVEGGGNLVLADLATGTTTTVETGGMSSQNAWDINGPLFVSPGYVVYTKNPNPGDLTTSEVRITPLAPVVGVAPTPQPTTLVSTALATAVLFSLDDSQVAVSTQPRIAREQFRVWLGSTSSGALATPVLQESDIGGQALGFLADHTLVGFHFPATILQLTAWRLDANGLISFQLDLTQTQPGLAFVSPDGAGVFYLVPGDDGDQQYPSLALFKSGDVAASPVVVRRYDPQTPKLSQDQLTLLVRGEMNFHYLTQKSSNSGSLFLLKANGQRRKILDYADENFGYYGNRYVLGASTGRPQPYGWLQSGPYLSSPPWMPPAAP